MSTMMVIGNFFAIDSSNLCTNCWPISGKPESCWCGCRYLMAEVWAEMQAHVEELTGQAGLQILRAVLENAVTRRVGPPHRPNPRAGCCAPRKAVRLCGLRWTEDPTGTTAGTNPRGPGSGTGATVSCSKRKTATSGAGTHDVRIVHTELSASGGECCGRLRDREARNYGRRKTFQESTWFLGVTPLIPPEVGKD
jgi:hypothetical protein